MFMRTLTRGSEEFTLESLPASPDGQMRKNTDVSVSLDGEELFMIILHICQDPVNFITDF